VIGRLSSSLFYFTLSDQFQSTLSDIFELNDQRNFYDSEAKPDFGIRSEQKGLKTVFRAVMTQLSRFNKLCLC
jgi:hypothetical protein